MTTPRGDRPQRSTLQALRGDPAAHAVLALGVTQIIAWGTTLYALGVLGQPIAADTGWSHSLVFGGLTVGLLAASLVSTWIGRLIDRWGARRVMVLGAAMNAAGLVWLSQVRDPYTYLAAWLFLGPAMRMTLYDAAFAALVQVTPSRGRRAISYLTLFGGFASTIFWPIGHALEGEVGWRNTLLIFAAFNLLIVLPLNALGLARREDPPDPVEIDSEIEIEDNSSPPARPSASSSAGPATSSSAPRPLHGRARTLALVLFGGVMSAMGFVVGAMAVHLVDLIAASGLAMASAVFLASLKGVGQVAGRIWDLVFARNLPAVTVARVSFILMPAAFLVLILGGASFAVALTFTLVLGVSHGLVTIVRGAVPLSLFGPQGYGEVLGILATPYLLMSALAPLILAAVIDVWGYEGAEIVLLAASAAAVVGMELTAIWIRRRTQ
jgi:hypothetical protein